MCGIAGFWAFNQKDISDNIFDCFVDSLAHRGPVSRGTWKDEQACLRLGHRRLAIFDLSDRGGQPMHYQERYVISFNGEIYNFPELRKELECLGHVFRSTCDTEIILASYAQWGEECQHKFNGIWAFAIWDRKNQELFVSRDRFGLKPVFYFSSPQHFAIASEMKAFLKLPISDWEIDEDVLSESLLNINGLEGSNLTWWKHLRRLPAGKSMRVYKDGNIKYKDWWNTYANLDKDVPSTFNEQTEKFKNLLFDACRIRMRSDLPVVMSLSGGLDSSSIASSIATLGNSCKEAYTVTFNNNRLDEFKYAKSVADFHNLFLHEVNISISNDTANLVDDIIWQQEDIYWTLPLGQWLLYQKVGKTKGIVMFDGGGGDELLCGQHFYLTKEMFRTLKKADFNRFSELRNIVDGMKGGSVYSLNTNFLYLLRQYLSGMGFLDKMPFTFISNFLNPMLINFLKDKLSDDKLINENALPNLPGMSPLNQDHYKWFHFTGLPTIARGYDRSAAAGHVAIRAPLLDHRLVTYAFNLPDQSKVGDGQARRILRESMKTIMPEHVRTRSSKIGFTSPLETWLREPLHKWLMDTINSGDFLNSNIWNAKKVIKYVNSCLKNKEGKIETIWPILNASVLLKQKRQKSNI